MNSHSVPTMERDGARTMDELVPLVYEELRRLAARKLAHDAAGQNLEPTGLVHEAYLRLACKERAPKWNSRGHFFGAAAEAMRRILVENARRKSSVKHGGRQARQELNDNIAGRELPRDLLVLSEALEQLAAANPKAAELVKLRYFCGLTIKQTAAMLRISPRSADLLWAFARAWLFRNLSRV